MERTSEPERRRVPRWPLRPPIRAQLLLGARPATVFVLNVSETGCGALLQTVRSDVAPGSSAKLSLDLARDLSSLGSATSVSVRHVRNRDHGVYVGLLFGSGPDGDAMRNRVRTFLSREERMAQARQRAWGDD
ncbi:MAG TPA: PilZ domain-containing protein, partial [Planctomycetota bacterium]|nr:PilZ domain-containing protein [Planctomycetota bacterium]